MTRKIIIAICLTTIAFFSKTYAQPIELYNTFFGQYDYTSLRNTMNAAEDQLNDINPIDYPCKMLASSSANLYLDRGQILVAAYLYWLGSGTGDLNVRLVDTSIVAERDFHYLHFHVD